MFDVMKRALLTGVGMAVMTTERVEEWAREMAKTSNLSAEKGAEFIRDAVQTAEKTRDEFERRVGAVVQERLAKAGLATNTDVERLLARIEELERKVAGMPTTGGTSPVV